MNLNLLPRIAPRAIGLGLFLAAGVTVDSGDWPDSVGPIRFGFGVDSLSSSFDFSVPNFALFLGRGDSSGSGEGLFLAAGVAVPFGFEAGRFLDLALRFAGFGFAAGSGVSTGAGEATTRISSRALMRASRFLASSSVNCALVDAESPGSWTSTPRRSSSGSSGCCTGVDMVLRSLPLHAAGRLRVDRDGPRGRGSVPRQARPFDRPPDPARGRRV